MDEGQRWFDRLAEGGKAGDAVRRDLLVAGLRRAVDRFGVPWMINVIPGPDWKPATG